MAARPLEYSGKLRRGVHGGALEAEENKCRANAAENSSSRCSKNVKRANDENGKKAGMRCDALRVLPYEPIGKYEVSVRSITSFKPHSRVFTPCAYARHLHNRRRRIARSLRRGRARSVTRHASVRQLSLGSVARITCAACPHAMLKTNRILVMMKCFRMSCSGEDTF